MIQHTKTIQRHQCRLCNRLHRCVWDVLCPAHAMCLNERLLICFIAVRDWDATSRLELHGWRTPTILWSHWQSLRCKTVLNQLTEPEDELQSFKYKYIKRSKAHSCVFRLRAEWGLLGFYWSNLITISCGRELGPQFYILHCTSWTEGSKKLKSSFLKTHGQNRVWGPEPEGPT